LLSNGLFDQLVNKTVKEMQRQHTTNAKHRKWPYNFAFEEK